LVAAWLRLWRLSDVPPGLWYDEAYDAMDALWMRDAAAPQIFFIGNNGREPMIHYLEAVTMSLFGATPYVFRLTSALVGILTVPLLYRWLVILFADEPARHALGLIAAAGLTISLWHVVTSRTGYRAILLPPGVIVTLCLFWSARLSGRRWEFAGAGLALGLSQYSYLSARLLPGVLLLFVAAWLLSRRRVDTRGLLLMAGTFGVVVAPLALFFLSHPGALSGRAEQVSTLGAVAAGKVSLPTHLLAAARVFVDGSDPNWRHNPVGQPGFDPLSLVGLWVGFGLAVSRWRQPRYWLLLLGLLVLWLPAPLSLPAVHTLRLLGMLPLAYALVAVGLLPLSKLAARRAWAGPVVALALLGVGGGSTAYNLFGRWANEPALYRAYDGPLVDLVRFAIAQTDQYDIYLPFQLYAHPTTRFLLYDRFPETDQPPPLHAGRPALVVEVPDFGRLSEVTRLRESPAYVRLSRAEAGQGMAFVLRLNEDEGKSDGPAIPFLDPHTAEPVAWLHPAVPQAQPFVALPLKDERLVGYDLSPNPIQPGATLTVHLYWRDLPPETAGRGFSLGLWGQPDVWEQSNFVEEWLRWRGPGLTITEHHLWLNPQSAPGPRLLRLGAGDGPTLGLFYVGAEGGTDPRTPPLPRPARLGDSLELLGYAPPLLVMGDGGALSLKAALYWRPSAPLDTDYDTVVTLLDADNRPVAEWAGPPFAGYYPTSRWLAGEVIAEEVTLPLPANPPAGEYRLLAGMRAGEVWLPALDAAGSLPANQIILTQATLP
jgi:hypothetical protein